MTTSWTTEVKPGQGWLMGQIGITMGGATDSVQNLTINMGSLGSATVWTAQTK